MGIRTRWARVVGLVGTLYLGLPATRASAQPSVLAPQHQDTAAVHAELRAIVQRLFAAMKARDTAAIRAIAHPTAMLYPLQERNGAPAVAASSMDSWIRSLATTQPGTTLDERLFGSTLTLNGGLASLWAEYEFWRGPQFSHCGIDHFTFGKSATGWQLLTLSYTVQLGAACMNPAATASTQPSTEGYLPVPGGRVWYRRIGNGPGLPILAVHGGPGGTSCGFAALAPLANDRPVIYYDQLGSGRSDHPADTTLWTVQHFVEELEAVRTGLGLDSLVLLGHSWGGALVAEYLLTAPRPAVRAVIFSSPLLSTPRWIADANTLRAEMPAALRAALDRHEADGTTNHPEYRAATDSFYARHVSRIPVPRDPSCAGLATNDTIYQQMWGPTEFRSTGSLRTWDRSADLKRLTIPALLVSGEFDEARPVTLRAFAATMRNAQVVTIPGAAHGTYREKPAEYQAAVRAFLREMGKGRP